MNLVNYRLEGAVAHITMDDGKVNVLSSAMLAALGAALDRAESDGAGAVLLAGREKAFSAGFDLTELMAGGASTSGLLRAGFEISSRLLAFPAPVVAACRGHAIAMGFFVLQSVDYRLAARGVPGKLVANEVANGLIVPRAALEICRARLAPSHFGRVTLLSEVYSVENAVEAGIVDRVVSNEELDGAASVLANQLALLNRPAHAETKRRARADLLARLAEGIELDLADFVLRAK